MGIGCGVLVKARDGHDVVRKRFIRERGPACKFCLRDLRFEGPLKNSAPARLCAGDWGGERGDMRTSFHENGERLRSQVIIATRAPSRADSTRSSGAFFDFVSAIGASFRAFYHTSTSARISSMICTAKVVITPFVPIQRGFLQN